MIAESIKAILLDIEGTTTPIDFVTRTLFPFARNRVGAYLEEHFGSKEVQADLFELRREQIKDLRENLGPPIIKDDSSETLLESAENYIFWLMDRDRKSTALKSLQGRIWEDGYRSGELNGQVFTDVPAAFERWRRQKKPICIYSSGSVLAQRLLFAHSAAGDLTGFITCYFDTNTGAKTASESYRRISESMQIDPAGIVFISDTIKELDAAVEAGMQPVLSVRPGNHPQSNANLYHVVRTFDDL